MEEIFDLKLDALQDPCVNCKDLLRQAGVDLWRFQTSLVETGAIAWINNLISTRGRACSPESFAKSQCARGKLRT